ncbi:hypothetical protein [Streptomyces sp. NBC_01750]|uniref:hypothetical protein n=1 Tax=Streptomyces sp. NBC_01750 TaxID=2975928 RepID=UPI002DDC782B|nr:hypothetical protein [Streptomyces sp. NBC_01750]WSD38152.1 hypothetical protein OG966_40600 [Streptomyces sp. NBC_01750]
MTIPHLRLPESIADTPQWTVTAAGAIVGLALLVLYARIIGRRAKLQAAAPQATGRGAVARQTVVKAGPLAVLGACGMVVSLYGLFGFATETMELPAVPFAISIMAIFDVAEVTCFVSLYRSAAVESAWTRPMRRTRRMAWMLVAASSAMNGAHAPGNSIAMVAFAAVPIVSAKLIEFELEKLLDSNAAEADEDARPGFVRLVQLGYVHAWAGIFAKLGIDAASRDGLIHQDARIRRAARKIHELGRALDALDGVEQDSQARSRQRGRAKKRVETVQGKAEIAIDVAGVAGDAPAQLMLARHLVTRGRVTDLARMDVRDPMGIVTTLEELAIVPSAEAIKAGARAALAEQQREEAEKARDAAQAAQAAAEAAAGQVREQAAAELTAAQKTRAEAEAAATAMHQKAQTAAQAAAEAESKRTAAQKAHDQLAATVEQLTSRAQDLKHSATVTDSERQAIADQLAALRRQAEEASELVTQRKREAEDAKGEAQQALAARRAAAADVDGAKRLVGELEEQAERLRADAQQYARQQQDRAAELERLAAEKEGAEAAARAAAERAVRAQAGARTAEEEQNAARVALRHARTEIMDALTSPEAYEPPRWNSEPKRRGWELYMHKVRTDGTEPTDAELAGEDRDPSTARKWLAEFRAELARMTAAALPAQQGAHDRTADEAPALV